MCDGELCLDAIGSRFAIDAERYFARELDTITDDLASYDREARTIRTTAVGKLLVRNVCMKFDRYQREAGRFSSTI
jgi:oxygen-independent coproporphyrinogen-3 oxidase